MSRRLRWPGGRPRPGGRPGGPPGGPATGPDDDPGDVLTATGGQVFDRILAAATGGRHGLLHLVGDPGGRVHLSGGHVLLVQTRAVPGIDLLLLHRTRPREERAELLVAMATAEGRDAATAQARRIVGSGTIPAPDLDALHQQAVADAAAALLVTEGTTLTRSRFFRGEQPWTRLSAPVSVDDLVTEAVRRRRLLDRTDGRIGPQSRPVRSAHLPVGAVRLTARRWELVTLADGRRTVRDLAWLLGQGIFVTTLEVARLHRLGLLEVRGDGLARDPAAPSADGRTGAEAAVPGG